MKKSTSCATNLRVTRKSLYLAVAAVSQLMISTQVLAGPEGGEVVGGQGSIDQSGLNTTIHQHTERMAIDWQSFNVNADEKVQFIQPSTSSVALNRVLSHSGSEIHGRIEANGHIVLVNPNGVFFGENSQINVGGIIASGLSINPNDFMNGEFTLTSLEGTEGKVVNSGIINAATGGSVTLVGQEVKNDGLISAKLGAVNLAAGKEAVVTFDASGLVGIRVTKEILQNELGVDAAVINNGEITAEGGRILLSASTSQDIFSQAVNHGELSASTSAVVHEDGSFTLGGGADVVNTGTISVASATGNAGRIVVVGENITNNGGIRADSAAIHGGSIELHSVNKTLLTGSAAVSAQATQVGAGGEIKILGNKVGLFDSAQVNASGANGGGEVLIGGDESGKNSRIRNADFIYLGENSSVKADALINGDGGKLITFASDTARFYGELSARGGEFGGNGGFIETSGLKSFQLTSTPDISAPAGKGGTWLIDPYDIDIEEGDLNIISPSAGNVFESSTSASVVRPSDLLDVLNTGGTVVIQTGNDSSGLGDITLVDNIEYNIVDGQTGTLRFLADNAIKLNSNRFIRRAGGTGSLNVEFIANIDINNANGGNITFNTGSYVNTHGGYFTASGLDFTIPDANEIRINTGRELANSNATAGGDIILNMTGAVSLGSNIRTDGGKFTVSDSASFTNNFTNGLIDTANDFGGGDIDIKSRGNITLGFVDFSYNYLNAENNAANLLRVGSVALTAGGDVTLDRELNFNNTGKRKGSGAKGYAGNLLDDQDTFLDITASGSININALIHDKDWGDGRDALNISLTADADSNGIGDVNINGDIYTAGGNFVASGFSFDSEGFSINANKANADDNANWSNGGDVTIRSSSTIKLGSITTDKECATPSTTACTGNLVITGRDTDLMVSGNQPANANVTQTASSILDVKGTTIFNVGTGNIALSNNNIFSSDLQFNSAGDVAITDTTAVNLGESSISGGFNLVSGGAITQSGAVTVGSVTRLNASGNNIDLSNNANNFTSVLLTGNAQAFTINDANDVAINFNGFKATNATVTAGNNITVNGIDTSSNTAGGAGGSVNLNAGTAGAGNINVSGTIATTGRNGGGGQIGGAGGSVALTTAAGNVSVSGINTRGGEGGGSANGGNAGTITLTGTAIALGGDLNSSGGKHGNTTAITGNGANIQLNGNVELNNSVILTAQGQSSGNITFTGTLDSQTATPRNLTVTGNTINFGGHVGATSRLGNLIITSATDLNAATRDFFVTSFNSTSTGLRANLINTVGRNNTDGGAVTVTTNATGTVIITDSITTQAGTVTAGAGKAGGAITITGNAIQLGAINTSGSDAVDTTLSGGNAGAVTVTASGTNPSITLNGDIATQGGSGATAETSTTGQFALTSAGTINLNAADFFTSNINLVGSAASDTLNGLNTASTWNTVSASGWNIRGTIASGQPATSIITVNGFENIQGNAAEDTFNLNHNVSGNVRGGNGNDFYNLYVSIDAALDGQSGNDTFEAKENIAAVIDGGDGSDDILKGANRPNDWVLQGGDGATRTNPNTLNGTGGVRFNGIEAVVGGSNVDSFTIIGGNYAGRASGGVGLNDENDIVNVSNELELNLASTDDIFRGITEVEILRSSQSGGGTLLTSSASGTEVMWDIFDFDGSGGSARFENKGTITYRDQTNKERIIKFLNFSSLTGGAGNDNFTFEGNSAITGVINGGAGFNSLDLSANTSAYSLELGNQANAKDGFINLNLLGINQVIGNSDSNTATELLLASGENIWTIAQLPSQVLSDGENDGSVQSSVAGLGTVQFINFANLTGGSGGDNFIFTESGRLTGLIDGGGAGNRITGRDIATTWNIASTGNSATSGIDKYLNTFTNIGTLQGGAGDDIFTISAAFNGVVNGGAGNDQFNFSGTGSATNINGELGSNSLRGRNTANTWNIANKTLAATDGASYVSYNNIARLQGGSAVDIFNLNAAFSGDIYGGGNADVFDISNAITGNLFGDAGDDQFLFSTNGSATSVSGGSGINAITGRNSANLWTLVAGNTGRVDAMVTSGGVTTAVNYLGSFSGIQTLNGGTDTDTLVGHNQQNDWQVTGANAGTVGAVGSLSTPISFTAMENLTGGTALDNFAFTSLTSSVSGLIDGGTSLDNSAVVDTLDLSKLTNGVRVKLGADNDSTTINVNNIETITAASLADGIASEDSNRLLGAGDTAYTWIIDGSNTGTVAPTDNPVREATTRFINFGNLLGGEDSDTFRIGQAGIISGVINGGEGRDFADYSQQNNVSITLGDGTLAETGIVSIEGILGNKIDSTLIGNNAGSIWSLEIGAEGDQGNVDNVIFFSGFTRLKGGAGADTFNAAIRAGAAGQIEFNGGAGTDRVNLAGGDASYRVTHGSANSGRGKVDYADGASNTYSLTYTGVENLSDSGVAASLTVNGSNAVDVFLLTGNSYSLNNFSNISYTNKNNLIISASSSDQVLIGDAVNIPQTDLTIQNASVSGMLGSRLTARSLHLNETANVGELTNRLAINVENLFVNQALGDMYLQEQNALNIAGFSSSNLFDLQLDGSLTSSLGLNFSGPFNVASTSGDIILDKANFLSGDLTLASIGAVTLVNSNTTNLAGVQAQTLNITSAGNISGKGAINVNGLASFNSTGNIDLTNAANNFNSVSVGSAVNASIRDTGSLTLAGVNASGNVSALADRITVSSALTAADLTLNAMQGLASIGNNITVQNTINVTAQGIAVAGNLSASAIDLKGNEGSVTLDGILDSALGGTTVAGRGIAQNAVIRSGSGVTITSTENFTQTANIISATDLLVSAAGDVNMNAGSASNAVNVEYQVGGMATIGNTNASKNILLNVTNAVTQQGKLLSAQGAITIDAGQFAMNNGAGITATNGAVTINSTGDISVRQVNAANNIDFLAAGGIQTNEQVTSTAGAINLNAGGNVTLAGALNGYSGINLRSVNGSVQQQNQLGSGQGNVVLRAGGDITMTATAVSDTPMGNINYTGNNISIAALNAQSGTVTLAAAGSVTNINRDLVNVSAQRLVIDAASGVGANSAIKSSVNKLSVSNNLGDIWLQNNKEVTVDRLRSNGNIALNNSLGNVILDNAGGTLFSLAETDARLAGGAINANYNIGTLTITVDVGSLIATGAPNIKNPDIVALNATLVAAGDIGSPGRPLVVYVKNRSFIAGMRSWGPFWGFDTPPLDPINASSIQGNLSDLLAAGNEQLVEVETLEEVDPAIFTSVRNYFYDDVSILMPQDQLYSEEEEE